MLRARVKAYLVQLYVQNRVTEEKMLRDSARLARRGTLKPAWIQAALTLAAAIHKQRKML